MGNLMPFRIISNCLKKPFHFNFNRRIRTTFRNHILSNRICFFKTDVVEQMIYCTLLFRFQTVCLVDGTPYMFHFEAGFFHEDTGVVRGGN